MLDDESRKTAEMSSFKAKLLKLYKQRSYEYKGRTTKILLLSVFSTES